MHQKLQLLTNKLDQVQEKEMHKISFKQLTNTLMSKKKFNKIVLLFLFYLSPILSKTFRVVNNKVYLVGDIN